MNQEHPQPSPVEYESGNPDEWAETPTKNEYVEETYDGDHVRRNELNFAEFAPSTFDHKDTDQWDGKGKYDNQKIAAVLRKAAAAERMARAVLRTADEKLIEDQALDLMVLPNQALVATLKRIDQVLPDSLSADAKYKRALACAKLAYNMLPKGAAEDHVEKLARNIMAIDDPTLKSILKTAAEVNVALQKKIAEDEEKEEEEEDGKEATMKSDDEESQEACMTAEDTAMLDGMIQQEVGQPPAPMQQTPELTAIFGEETQGVPAEPCPCVASDSDSPEITFVDDEEPARTASNNEQLNHLFDDLPDVQAQREIVAAEQEQRVREGGFNVTRTASTGAKKIGQVRASKTNPVEELENLWERPPGV
jgi:hypothetical protein